MSQKEKIRGEKMMMMMIALIMLIIIMSLQMAIVVALAINSVPIDITTTTIRIGTRPSKLAIRQAEAVAKALSNVHDNTIKYEIVKIQAQGDHKTTSSSKTSGGTQQPTSSIPLAVSAVDFTGALDDALVDNSIDIAVHSFKDIPPSSRWKYHHDLIIAGHLPRQDPCDVLIGQYPTIMDLPKRATVGTSSIRRQAQLLYKRPDLNIINIRGNIDTRLQDLQQGNIDALILAMSGLKRMGFITIDDDDKITADKSSEQQPKQQQQFYPIPSEDMLSGCCQGIVAMVCRTDDITVQKLLQTINNHDSHIAAAAERSFLDTLDSFSPSTYHRQKWIGRPPLAALMKRQQQPSMKWIFKGLLARPDGSKVVKTSCTLSADCSVQEAIQVGQNCGKDLMQQAGSRFYNDDDE